MNSLDRLMPHNEDAERAVLGAILLDNKILDELINKLTEESFYTTGHAIIYKAIKELKQSNSIVDIITLSEELEKRHKLDSVGGRFYLATLVENVVTISNAVHHTHLLKEKESARWAIRFAGHLAEKAYNPIATSQDLIEFMQSNVFKLTSNIERKTVSPIELAMHMGEYLEKIKANPNHITGLSTGFESLDRSLGGMQKGTKIVIGARPGAGKTALAQQIAFHVASVQQKSVLYFFLEMTRDMAGIRLLSHITGVNSRTILTGYFSDAEFNRLVNKGCVDIGNSKFIVDDMFGLTSPQLAETIRKTKIENPDLELVVVDFIQQCDLPLAKSRNDEITAWSKATKGIAKEMDVCLIEVSQLNRQCDSRVGDDRMPRKFDLRDSGSLEQDADQIMFLYRRHEYTHADEDLHHAQVLVDKNKMGLSGRIVDLHWEPTTTTFSEINKSPGLREPLQTTYNYENN